MGFASFFKSVGKAIENVAKSAGKVALTVVKKAGRVAQVLAPIAAIASAIPGLNIIGAPLAAAIAGTAALGAAAESAEFVGQGGLKHV